MNKTNFVQQLEAIKSSANSLIAEKEKRLSFDLPLTVNQFLLKCGALATQSSYKNNLQVQCLKELSYLISQIGKENDIDTEKSLLQDIINLAHGKHLDDNKRLFHVGLIVSTGSVAYTPPLNNGMFWNDRTAKIFHAVERLCCEYKGYLENSKIELQLFEAKS